MPDASELSKWSTTANAIVDESRASILKSVRGGFEHRLKDDNTFVTDVDLTVERLLRKRLKTRFPEHGIVGEEYEATQADARFCWVIDPIDGTHSFRHGLPLYGTILALLEDGRPILGVIDMPALDIRLSGAKGLGAVCNKVRLRMRDIGDDPLDREIVATGERQQFVRAGQAAVFDHLMASHSHVRCYSDVFGHVLAMQGGVGAMVDFDLSVWDVSATELLVAEAGGRFVTVFRGKRSDAGVRADIVFGKSAVVDWVVDRIKEARV